ncbi:MAG: toll/interleukin-1 receptor domain-containing protein [Anaerolineae bacterium]|nr:toll/interleukin-1 receptor domain-containing protein [Anaerolineae bacterium]
MADAFISYDRQDQTFARQLVDGLNSRVIQVWIDWADITLGSNWWGEIRNGIQEANSFICLLSPAWSRSPVCQLELDHALRLGKRIIPVVIHPHEKLDGSHVGQITEAATKSVAFLPIGDGQSIAKITEDNWKAVGVHNWIFYEDNAFERFVDRVFDAIQTDREYARKHTNLLMSAQKWDARGRKSEYLLRGEELQDALTWLAGSPGKSPSPIELQQIYITESQLFAQRATKSLIGQFNQLLRRWTTRPPQKIFISYRRADSAYACGHIFDRLKAEFSERDLFLDVDTIDYGADFSAFIQTTLTECCAVLVVIGPQWLEILQERLAKRERDFVLIEVETALRRHHITVIPVLVEHARLPRPEELPESLRTLPKLNGATVRAGRDFNPDVNSLIRELKHLRSQAKAEYPI